MKTGFGEKCAAVRRGLGIAQVYMANLLGLGSSKAFSRFEHDDGSYTDDQYEAAAKALGFRSADSLMGFDLRKAIARYEAEKDALPPPAVLGGDPQVLDVARLQRENQRLMEMVELLLGRLFLAKGQ